MCGITGFFSNTFSEEQLLAMTRKLKHRGPDAEGYYYNREAGIGLGHRRLSILDLSVAANNPFWSKDGRYVMVYNGEVYNFREVAEKYNIIPITSSDTEIIIEAFAKKGIDCLQDFNGMFAMAIWDSRDKKLYLIRDRFGVKPLVYYKKGETFAFASELKALLELGVDKRINMAALQDYFFLEYIPGPNCILQNFHKLPNGHYAEISDGQINIKAYYQFREKIIPRPVIARSENETLDEFESLLMSSVKYRQISDVPIGAFLSGGVDSSLICALFQKQNSSPINTFTIGFDVPDYNESGYASSVAKILKTNHCETQLTDKSSISIVDNIVDFFDEPFSAPSTIPSYFVCNVAKRHVTVAMSGDGGDELFMGYGHYEIYRKIKYLYRFDPGVVRFMLKKFFNGSGGRYERASRLFDIPAKNLLAHLWSEQQYMFSEREIKKLVNVNETELSLPDIWSGIDKMPLSDFEKISLFDIEQYLTHNLLYKMDAASMSNGLEVRNPYLDYRLMEFCYNLPQSYKIKEGVPKYLMKKLLERYLPKDLIYRRKWGFPAPIGDWMSKDLSYLIEKWLNPARIKSQGIFNENMTGEYVKAFKGGKKFHDKRIWAIIIFQMWSDKYLG